MAVGLNVKLPDYLEQSNGEIRVTGHRVSLYHVLCEFNEGHSPEEIVLRLPTLKLSTVYKIVGFYLENQIEVDRFLSEYRQTLATQASEAQPAITKAELLQRLELIRLKAHNAAQVSH